MENREFYVMPSEAYRVVFTEEGSRFEKIDPEPIRIRIVDDAPCPYCGLDWPNRPKVGDRNGNWWWKCYGELFGRDCVVEWYLPEKRLVHLKEPYIPVAGKREVTYDELRQLFPGP
jgi:hypothetical protein